jgi:hypothetical protein
MWAAIRVIRQRGWSFDDEEHALSTRCVAAPIYNEHAEVLGAISLAGPSSRLPDERIKQLGQLSPTSPRTSRTAWAQVAAREVVRSAAYAELRAVHIAQPCDPMAVKVGRRRCRNDPRPPCTSRKRRRRRQRPNQSRTCPLVSPAKRRGVPGSSSQCRIRSTRR